MKEFLIDNYLIIMLVIAFFIFALIGYLIDVSRRSSRKEHLEEEVIETEVPEVKDINEPKPLPEQNIVFEEKLEKEPPVVAEPEVFTPLEEAIPEPVEVEEDSN